MKRLILLVVLIVTATIVPAGASLNAGAKPSKTCAEALNAGDDAINAGLELAVTGKQITTDTDPGVLQIHYMTLRVQTENLTIRQTTYALLEKRCRAGK